MHFLAQQTDGVGYISDPPHRALEKLRDVIEGFKREEACFVDMEAPRTLCGRVVNVLIWEESQWNYVKDLKVGTFIRLRNLTEKYSDGWMRCKLR